MADAMCINVTVGMVLSGHCWQESCKCRIRFHSRLAVSQVAVRRAICFSERDRHRHRLAFRSPRFNIHANTDQLALARRARQEHSVGVELWVPQ